MWVSVGWNPASSSEEGGVSEWSLRNSIAQAMINFVTSSKPCKALVLRIVARATRHGSMLDAFMGAIISKRDDPAAAAHRP